MSKFPRFSLRWFLAGVAYVAFGCAAFMQPYAVTANLFQSLTWGIIVAGLIASVVGNEGTRAKARGFAIASLLYSVVGIYEFGPTFGPHQLTEWFATRAQIKAAPYLAARFAPAGFVTQDGDGWRINLGPNGIYAILEGEDWDQNRRTAHLSAAIVWGLAGGWLASIITPPTTSQSPRPPE